MILLTDGGAVSPVPEEEPAGTVVPTKSTAEEIGERLMETADTMAHDMGIPTAALIAIIIGKYVIIIIITITTTIIITPIIVFYFFFPSIIIIKSIVSLIIIIT
jgi:hypothetical protein